MKMAARKKNVSIHFIHRLILMRMLMKIQSSISFAGLVLFRLLSSFLFKGERKMQYIKISYDENKQKIARKIHFVEQTYAYIGEIERESSYKTCGQGQARRGRLWKTKREWVSCRSYYIHQLLQWEKFLFVSSDSPNSCILPCFLFTISWADVTRGVTK